MHKMLQTVSHFTFHDVPTNVDCFPALVCLLHMVYRVQKCAVGSGNWKEKDTLQLIFEQVSGVTKV